MKLDQTRRQTAESDGNNNNSNSNNKTNKIHALLYNRDCDSHDQQCGVYVFVCMNVQYVWGSWLGVVTTRYRAPGCSRAGDQGTRATAASQRNLGRGLCSLHGKKGEGGKTRIPMVRQLDEHHRQTKFDSDSLPMILHIWSHPVGRPDTPACDVAPPATKSQTDK